MTGPNGLRNCTRDEGGPLGFGNQVLISSHRKLLRSKAVVVSVAVNVGRISRRVRLREASASKPSMNCRKRSDDVKTGGWHFLRVSLGDVLRLTKRHPAYRRREAQPGSCMERENLAGHAKGKGTSGSNREAESTDAPSRGGLLHSSDEAG